MAPLIQSTALGLYCSAGDFYLDPWRPVPRAVISHAHGDHARPGCERYLTSRDGERVLRVRLGEANVDTAAYGQVIEHNGVRISFHPAGHVLGSAQIRLEHEGEVWVYSGDYKTAADPTTPAFAPIRCHVFITESTFGLPIYRWPAAEGVFADINEWWRKNQDAGKASVIFGYSLGKAQRVLAGIDPSIGPIFTHGAVEPFVQAYRDSGVPMPPTTHVAAADDDAPWERSLIVAPPSARGSPWLKRFGRQSTAFASGWVLIRGARRRQALDRGFVLSDHVDWPALMSAIAATGARRILVTHGNVAVVVRWLQENGYDAGPLETRFEDDELKPNDEARMTNDERMTKQE
jgi:putative mRNA 3-end processing factor